MRSVVYTYEAAFEVAVAHRWQVVCCLKVAGCCYCALARQLYSLVYAEPYLDKSIYSIQVQMVAGLIQEQDVRLAEGDLGKRHSALLAS